MQQPRPPIWFAANNDAAVVRAAQLGDAWVINPHAKLAVLERQMGVYRQALRDAGRPFPGELPIIKELYEAKYKAYASWGQDKALPEGDSFAHEFEELVAHRFIVGDPDDAVREIRRYADRLGTNTFIFRIQWPGMEQAKVLRTITLLAERVFPALDSQRARG